MEQYILSTCHLSCFPNIFGIMKHFTHFELTSYACCFLAG